MSKTSLNTHYSIITYSHLCASAHLGLSVDIARKHVAVSHNSLHITLCSLVPWSFYPEHTSHYGSVMDYMPWENPVKWKSCRILGGGGLGVAVRATHHDARCYKSQMAALMLKICSVFVYFCFSTQTFRKQDPKICIVFYCKKCSNVLWHMHLIQL